MLAKSEIASGRVVCDLQQWRVWKRFRSQGPDQKGRGFHCSNIAEGKERVTIAEFIRYLYIAKGSAGELKTQLLIAQDIGYLDQMSSKELRLKIESVSAMIGALIKTLKNGK